MIKVVTFLLSGKVRGAERAPLSPCPEEMQPAGQASGALPRPAVRASVVDRSRTFNAVQRRDTKYGGARVVTDPRAL